MNQRLGNGGSGGVIAWRTRGSQLISGGPGFERKCSCNTEPFLPSLSCPRRGGGGTWGQGWQGRGRGLSVRPWHLAGVCTPTQAHVHTCAHIHRKPPLHTSPITKLCPLSFHSLHWMTSQPCPRPGAARSPSRRCSPSNQTLLQCSGPAQYCHGGLQDFMSSSGPTPCPLPLLSLSYLCSATLASLSSSVPQLLHMLFPLPGKLSFLTHLADSMCPSSLSFHVIFSEHQVFPSAHCLRGSVHLPPSHALSAQHGFPSSHWAMLFRG